MLARTLSHLCHYGVFASLLPDLIQFVALHCKGANFPITDPRFCFLHLRTPFGLLYDHDPRYCCWFPSRYCQAVRSREGRLSSSPTWIAALGFIPHGLSTYSIFSGGSRIGCRRRPIANKRKPQGEGGGRGNSIDISNFERKIGCIT